MEKDEQVAWGSKEYWENYSMFNIQGADYETCPYCNVKGYTDYDQNFVRQCPNCNKFYVKKDGKVYAVMAEKK